MEQINDYGVSEIKRARSIEIPRDIKTDFKRGDRVSIVSVNGSVVVQKLRKAPVKAAIQILESIGKD